MGELIQLFTKESKIYQQLRNSIANNETDPERAIRLKAVVNEMESIFKEMNSNPPNFQLQLPENCAQDVEKMAFSLKKHYSEIIFDLMDIILAEKLKNVDLET